MGGPHDLSGHNQLLHAAEILTNLYFIFVRNLPGCPGLAAVKKIPSFNCSLVLWKSGLVLLVPQNSPYPYSARSGTARCLHQEPCGPKTLSIPWDPTSSEGSPSALLSQLSPPQKPALDHQPAALGLHLQT